MTVSAQEHNNLTISNSDWRRYFWSCGLLILPILAWNLVFFRFLPPAFAPAEFWREIPPFVGYGENILRFAVLLLTFLMPLEMTTAVQRRGLRLFVVGTVLYLMAWCALMLYPQSAWSKSWAGFLAPAYTPLIWLLGLGLIGRRLYWNSPYRWWLYEMLVCGFIALHVTHTGIVYARSY